MVDSGASNEPRQSHVRPCEQWRLRTRTLTFGKLPMLMGILNVTPDSFSDGGQFFEPQRAVEQAQRLIAAGADIIDVGGESTRPYSEPVTAEEELRRVIPVVEAIAGETDAVVSIDTSKAEVARSAITAGAEIINDVTALTGDEEMMRVVVESGVGVSLMHMQGTPKTMQDDPRYTNVVSEVGHYLATRRDACVAAGIGLEKIALDPGIGFGKTHGHNLRLLSNCGQYHELGCPLMIGHSRKGFIGKVIGDRDADRTAGSIGTALAMAKMGIQVLRVHDVQAVREALLLFEASGGLA